MTKYVYRVAEAYTTAGAAGAKLRKVGALVPLDRPAKHPGRALELAEPPPPASPPAGHADDTKPANHA